MGEVDSFVDFKLRIGYYLDDFRLEMKIADSSTMTIPLQHSQLNVSHLAKSR